MKTDKLLSPINEIHRKIRIKETDSGLKILKNVNNLLLQVIYLDLLMNDKKSLKC